MGEQQLADIASALYRLPLEGFVAARTAAAKTAAADSGRDLADSVRSLPKPSAAAWAVNMLAVHRPDELSELDALGAAMRSAQEELDAGALRALSQERRQLLTRVMGTAREVAEQQGRKISAAVAAEVEATLRAATVDEGAASAVRSGRLLRVLSADGVDRVDLRDAVAVPGAPAQPAVPTSGSGLSAGAQGAQGAPGTPKHGVPKSAPPDSPPVLGTAERPRLKAVGTKRPAPAPSAVERAAARLSEAEEAARSAAEEARQRTADFDEAETALTRLGDEARSLRARLKTVEEEFELARRRRESAAAQMQLAARAAEKEQRAEVLARERVLRLRNTPD
ncbi:hypothetical protein PV761_19440 [Arthrobacter sp. CC3]|uniref:hypothetical protein n=1 Tax=Arthrobacter sp. CC3 TaxID=3029185 RepID=UPI003264B3DE